MWEVETTQPANPGPAEKSIVFTQPHGFQHLHLDLYLPSSHSWSVSTRLTSCPPNSWRPVSSPDILPSCIFHVAATNGKSCTAEILAR